MILPSSLKHYDGMIRRLLALFALLTLALMSAAVAHEHGMGQRHVMAPVEAAGHPTVTLATTDTPQLALGRRPLREPSACSETGGTRHSHGKLSGCTCPAACAGLFGVTVSATPAAAETAARIPAGIRRLSATSTAPPTPPPRA